MIEVRRQSGMVEGTLADEVVATFRWSADARHFLTPGRIGRDLPSVSVIPWDEIGVGLADSDA